METPDLLPINSVTEFESWLSAHGAAAAECWAVIYKKSSTRQTVSFAELLDAALCYGWIDVKTKGIDDDRYAIRFVPRKPGSNWSELNRTNAQRLLDEGRMTPAGLASLPDEL